MKGKIETELTQSRLKSVPWATMASAQAAVGAATTNHVPSYFLHLCNHRVEIRSYCFVFSHADQAKNLIQPQINKFFAFHLEKKKLCARIAMRYDFP